jgi:hypothetical protein
VAIRNSPPTIKEVASLRARLWGCGFRPVAVYSVVNGRCGCGDSECGSAGKHPKGEGWRKRAMANPPEAAEAPPTADALNTGVATIGFQAPDIDIDDPTVARKVQALALEILGDGPLIRYRQNSPRTLLLYRASEGEPGKTTIEKDTGDENNHCRSKSSALVSNSSPLVCTHPASASNGCPRAPGTSSPMTCQR